MQNGEEVVSLEFLHWLMEGSRLSPIVAHLEYAALRDRLITESIINDHMDDAYMDIDSIARYDPAEDSITSASKSDNASKRR